MMLVPLITALLCACAHYVAGLGMPVVGYPMGLGMMGMGHGGMGLGKMGMGFGKMGDSDDGDRFLTCSNKEFNVNGALLFAVAVTVKDDGDSSPRGGMWGMGGGMNGWWNQGMKGGRSNRGGLSAQIELLNDVNGGLGLVAFTQRAQPENLCSLDGTGDFGPNLLGSDDDDDFSSYGVGGYGGMGMYGGYGMGMGFGMGMGYPSMIDYSLLDFETEDGVVAELPIVRRQVSTLKVDGLPFRSLSELAGRGLVVCPSVQVTEDNQYVCEKPFYACCQLRFDNFEAKLEV